MTVGGTKRIFSGGPVLIHRSPDMQRLRSIRARRLQKTRLATDCFVEFSSSVNRDGSHGRLTPSGKNYTQHYALQRVKSGRKHGAERRRRTVYYDSPSQLKKMPRQIVSLIKRPKPKTSTTSWLLPRNIFFWHDALLVLKRRHVNFQTGRLGERATGRSALKGMRC